MAKDIGCIAGGIRGLQKELGAEFPREQVSWRAQSLTKDGSKALALAYIDARDVMGRLDDVCGVQNWQCCYPHVDKKTVCRISIRIDGEWISKENGAGDTDIEAEKGAISDAFKRAAVMWGIGRYLYDIPAPWVPCESSNGKWKSWKESPWKYLASHSPQKKPAKPLADRVEACKKAVAAAKDYDALLALTDTGNYRKLLADADGTGWKAEIMTLVSDRLIELQPEENHNDA